MRNIEEKLNQLIFDIKNRDTFAKLNSFVSTFFNRRIEGNKAVLIGLHNKDIIKQLLGTAADVVIKDEAQYTICINKQRKGREASVHILFDSKVELNEKQRNYIVELFQHYSAEDNYNLISAFKNGYIPNLTIQGDDKVHDFLDNPHPTFRNICGENLVKKITIDYDWATDEEEVYTSLSELYIVTKNNRLLKPLVSEEEYANQLCSVMKEAIPNIESLNFVLLNTPDDHLRRFFDELITIYHKKFSLDDTNGALLHRIFFDLNKGCDTRMEFRNNLQLYSDANAIKAQSEDIALYVMLLDILHQDTISGDTNKKIIRYWEEYKETTAKRTELEQAVSTLEEYIRLLPEYFLQAKTKTEEVITYLNNPPKNTTKEDCFKAIGELVLCVADYAVRYNVSANKEIADFKAEIDGLKEKYEEDKNKKVLIFIPKNAESQLGKFRECIVKDIHTLWDCVTARISLGEWWSQSVNELEKTYGIFDSYVTEQAKDVSPAIKVLSLLNGQTTRYVYALKELQDSMVGSYDNLKNSENIVRGEFSDAVLASISKAQTVLSEDCEDYSKELSDFISDNTIRVQMQDLLFGELKRIL